MSVMTVPIRHAATLRVSNVDKKSAAHELSVRLVNYTDVYYNDIITPALDLMAATATADQAARFGVQPGDTIITKDSETPEDIGVPAFVAEAEPDMVCGYHLAILRPGVGFDAKFFNWAVSSDRTRQQFAVSANGMTRFGLSQGGILGAGIPQPPLEEQRRIADFLDDQTARIDQIISARDRQLELVAAVVRSIAVEALDAESKVPLRRLVAQAGVGIVVRPSDWYTDADDGVPALRGTDVAPFRIDEAPGVRITPEGDAFHHRSRLRMGDVVVVRTGDAGAAACVPAGAQGFNAIDLVILRANRETLPEYLEFVINASRWSALVGAASAGSIQQHFGVNAVLGMAVPWLTMTRQATLVDEFARVRVDAEARSDVLRRSISLLQEFRRSLISAAVAGDFDVSTASGRWLPA